MILPPKVTYGMVGVILAGVILIGMVNLTDACKLKTVHYNDTPVKDWEEKFGLNADAILVRQPVDSLSTALLAGRRIFKVDVSYSFPDQLSIVTNDFDPVCYVLDRYTGNLYGLNSDARVVPIGNSDLDWERPVLTSTSISRMFDFCSDIRVEIVVAQLLQLKTRHRDLFRLIDEIDFGNSGFLKVSVDGLAYRLKVSPEHLCANLEKFVDFLSKFNPSVENVELMDLRFDDMIVCADKKGSHGR